MRITSNQVNKLFEIHTNKVHGAAGAGCTQVQGLDQLTMSSRASDINTAKSAISSMSDIRLDKVNYFRDSVASGEYKASDQDVAQAILQNAMS